MRAGIAAAILALSLAVSNAAPAQTNYLTANDLHSNLRDLQAGWAHDPNANLISGVRGYGYVLGVGDSLKAFGIICPPDGVTIEQEVAIVQKYLDANPESWTNGAEGQIFVALHKVWPCPQNR
jgi:hypothetical protein